MTPGRSAFGERYGEALWASTGAIDIEEGAVCMATVVTMPKLGLTMKQGTVVKWLVEEGATVAAGTPIAEIMTEKITSKVESTAAGVLLKVLVAKGEKAAVGAMLAVVGGLGEDISDLLTTGSDGQGVSAPAPVGSTPEGARIIASPAARKLAQELGLDLSRVIGTGSGGRISREDVLAAEEAGTAVAEGRAIREEIAYEGMRRAIGEHMAMSWTLAPKVTHHASLDVSELLSFRANLNRGRKDRDKVSVTALLVKAAATALTIMPQLNASLEGDSIRVWDDINVGVAMALPDGLIVPVVRNADRKGFNEIGREINGFARNAKRNRIQPDDLVGGTFTVTNLGGYGSVDWFTPIINQPESAILGVGRTVDRVVAVDGTPAVRPTMGLSLSFDHRVIDGAPAASFLALFMGLLTNPYRMVL
jgi:pyruvate dehydrogenase E2 component (dihydrolipoamide acetyltransferase)